MSEQKGKSGLLIVLVLIVVAAAAAYMFLPRGTSVSVPAAPSTAAKPADAAPAAGTTPTATAETASAASAPVAAPAPIPTHSEMSVAELLKNAGAAVGAGRLIEPAGNNAAEYYLAVLDKDANNDAARDGLREMFPLATGQIEQQINAGQIDEGMRSITLLGRADANNYTLTILRNKLDLKKKQLDRDQEKRDQEKTLAANAARNTNTPPAATVAPPAAEPPAPAAAPSSAAQGPAVATAVPPPAAASAPASPAPAPPTPAVASAAAAAASGESRAATLVQKVNPNYPPDAARKHLEGWVEVGFTVGPDGHVKDAAVVGANPARIFNEAALRAVEGWVFQPRLEGGKAVDQRVRSRIEFKL